MVRQGRKMVRQQFFALVVSIILILSLKEVGAFVLPTITSSSRLTSTSPLSYGPSNDSADEIDPLSLVNSGGAEESNAYTEITAAKISNISSS